jgi:predicted nucleic acid-binding protein
LIRRLPGPDDLYLDTSVVVGAIIAGTPHSERARQALTEWANTGGSVYFSQILRAELSQALRNLASRPGQVPQDTREQFRLDSWSTESAVRERWLQHGVSKFRGFVASFDEVFELPFTTQIWNDSLRVIIDSGLQSIDAIHVATATRNGIRTLATLDDHFRRVPDLRVWLLRDDEE